MSYVKPTTLGGILHEELEIAMNLDPLEWDELTLEEQEAYEITARKILHKFLDTPKEFPEILARYNVNASRK